MIIFADKNSFPSSLHIVQFKLEKVTVILLRIGPSAEWADSA